MIFDNNTCVGRTANIYSSCSVDKTLSVYSNNRYFVPGGNVSAHAGIVKGFSCEGGDWNKWQKAGQDLGSTISGVAPSTATMIGWGRDLLQIDDEADVLQLLV